MLSAFSLDARRGGSRLGRETSVPKEKNMAVKIPAEVQEFLKGKMGWVATAGKDGLPNVSIKGSLRMLDDEHLVFADIYSLKTRKNLQENPKAAVMVYEEASRRAFMIQGSTEQIASGLLYDQTVEGIKRVMPQLPPPKYVVRVTVEAVFDQSAGPNGGRQLA
jgi:predicted pyridoxine 5'-phosphate oxidase superfamily flavin-nucleotide-binding protein